jgi:hypothetical protein
VETICNLLVRHNGKKRPLYRRIGPRSEAVTKIVTPLAPNEKD